MRGYIKSLQSAVFTDNPDSLSAGNIIHNRLNFKYNSSSFEAALELRTRLLYGENLRSFPGIGDTLDKDKGYFDLTAVWLNKKSVIGITEIDRAWLMYKSKNLEIKLGRQRVNWGISLIWNPNDIFNTYNFYELDYDERPGSDAVTARYYTGLISNIELAVKPGESKNENVIAAKYLFNRWSYDFQLLSGIYYDDLVFGAGWAGNIYDAGFKGEISYFTPRKNDNLKDALSASAAFDYSFQGGLYLGFALLYTSLAENNSGAIRNISYLRLSPKMLSESKWSLLTQAVYSFSPILSGNISLSYFPGTESVIIYPALQYSISDEWGADLIAQSLFGKQQGTFKAINHNIVLRVAWSF
jgi:hypothetical protein